jgi:hypothetical protein
LFNGNKFKSLDNFNKEFKPLNTIIIIDNGNEELNNYISKTKYKETISSALGNAPSFLFAVNYAINTLNEATDYVYFVEDDYLYLPNSCKILKEGLQRSHYVTLYDHPDKYINHNEGGPNPFVDQGGENTKVILTDSCHWKLTNSTTMTFATSVKTLKEDLSVWTECCNNRTIPDDFATFIKLRNKGRTLISPLPGYSTHTETAHLSPLIDWDKI